jgi:hypothetical protein
VHPHDRGAIESISDFGLRDKLRHLLRTAKIEFPDVCRIGNHINRCNPPIFSREAKHP